MAFGSAKPPSDQAKAAVTADIPSERHVFHSGQLRGVWVPYFSISDGEPLGEYEFKRRWDDIIKTIKDNGVNAVFVHVRAHCDSAYPSDIFPDMDIYKMHETVREYDPLQYMVESSHKNGIEFHAWINPYRIAADKDSGSYEKVSALLGADEIIECESGLYIDPSSVRGRELITAGAKEIAENYAVDGIHIDDYFYPTGEEDADTGEWKSSSGMTFTQWRCANVNELIKSLHDAVKSVDSEMLFGVSPQGNITNDLDIGADVQAWCEGGYVDYIAPQIYYNSENPVCPFEKTADFWLDMAEKTGVKMYAGLALYKVGTDADGGTWDDESIIEEQEAYAKKIGGGGVILYSIDSLINGG